MLIMQVIFFKLLSRENCDCYDNENIQNVAKHMDFQTTKKLLKLA